MPVILGFIIVFASIYVGYTMHGGKMGVLMQVSEFIIIFGAGIGALVIGNSFAVVKRIVRDSFALLKPSPHGHEANADLLRVLYELFYLARRDGLVGIEEHVESPESSELIKREYIKAAVYAIAALLVRYFFAAS